MITFLCSCGARLQVPDTAAGKKSRCPKCQAAVRVPPGPSKILAGETEEDAPTRPLPVVPPPEDDEDTRPLPPAAP